MLRAALEGIVFRCFQLVRNCAWLIKGSVKYIFTHEKFRFLNKNLRCLQKKTNNKPLCVDGGVSKNEFIMQYLAEMLQEPIECTADAEGCF